MRKSAELLSQLGDQVDAIERHISSMNDLTLRALEASLPAKAPAGSAAMMMWLLVYREGQRRQRDI
jgi:hypothetical protein